MELEGVNMAKVYMFLADGFEEVGKALLVDLLRRAEIEVVMTSIMGRQEVTGRTESP